MANKKDMSKFYTVGKKQVARKLSHDDENNKYFDDWGVHKVNDYFEVRYVKSAQGGGVQVFKLR